MSKMKMEAVVSPHFRCFHQLYVALQYRSRRRVYII